MTSPGSPVSRRARKEPGVEKTEVRGFDLEKKPDNQDRLDLGLDISTVELSL